ncbi:T-cell surface glycoprotein CD1a isoform X5 [Macaca fascicularis]|uniref:T-cell surface glycoprotein CD1a isoform X5 n=1 Tax=Macaca fascicularis TaxID=9541 RepID=UPI0032B078DF
MQTGSRSLSPSMSSGSHPLITIPGNEIWSQVIWVICRPTLRTEIAAPSFSCGPGPGETSATRSGRNWKCYCIYAAFGSLRECVDTPVNCSLSVTGGCELHSGKFSGSFLRLAYQGSDFMSFQNNSWLPSPVAGNMAKRLCKVINRNQHQNDIIHSLLSDTCPRLILGLLDAGKAHLQRQVKPEAWLSRGLSPGPGRLQLVCHVSGFYPKPVWVMWMRGEQEQQGTQRGDILPNADGTWYLRATQEVAAGEAADLSCRVKHSSLEGQDIILYWEHHSSMGLIILAVIVPLLLLIGLALWFRKRCFR